MAPPTESGRKTALPWSPAEEEMYIGLMIEGRRQGQMGERFKPVFFKECVKKMLPRFPNTNVARLNSKRASWRKTYRLFLKL